MDRESSVTSLQVRVFLLVAGFVVVSVIIGALTSGQDHLIYYQPLFFLLPIAFSALAVDHDIKLLRLGKLPRGSGLGILGPSSEQAGSGLSPAHRASLYLRIGMAILFAFVATYATLPHSVPVFRRLWHHLF